MTCPDHVRIRLPTSWSHDSHAFRSCDSQAYPKVMQQATIIPLNYHVIVRLCTFRSHDSQVTTYLQEVGNEEIEEGQFHNGSGEQQRGVWLNLDHTPQPRPPVVRGHGHVDIDWNQDQQSQQKPHWGGTLC